MVRITCINKDNGDHYDPYLGITDFGWKEESTGKTGKCTRSQMVTYLEEGNTAYVADSRGNVVWLVVRLRQGVKYVKTESNGKETDNLLALSECFR